MAPPPATMLPRRRGDDEEPQGGRRTDVAGTAGRCRNWPSGSTTAKSATSSSCAATACTARCGSCRSPAKPAGNSEELLYQIRRFHSFLWASGGCFSDFLHPHHRPLLLDEGRLAGQAQALGGRHYRGDLRRPELRHLRGRIHVPPTGPSSAARAAACRAAKGSTPATPTAPRARPSSPRAATAGSLPHLQGPSDIAGNMIWQSKAHKDERGPTERMERPGRRHPQRTSPTTR